MASNKSILEINTNQIDNSNKKNISNMKKTDISNKKKKDISLKYDDWESYIIDRKHLLIKELNDKSYLAKVEDNVKFIDIMKNISNTNILNLTYIGFLFVKFLENIYVDEHIILNCIELYSDEKYFIQSKENSKYIDNLKCLINAIPDMIIKIEFSFNLHFLILLYFLKQLKSNNQNQNQNNNNTFSRYINKNTSNLLNIIGNLSKQINESSIILLLFKLIRNIANTQAIDITNEFIIQNKEYLDKCKNCLDEQEVILDDFIVNINSENSYEVCNKYVLEMVRIIFQEMQNIFKYVIEYLLKSEHMDNVKRTNITYLDNIMKNFMEIEKINIEKIINNDKL